jgi:hypothetical protein
MHYAERPSTRYADEVSRAIRGLFARATDLIEPLELTTRIEKWVIQAHKAEPCDASTGLPWTRFNNCAGPYKSIGCAQDAAAAANPLPEVAC